MHADVVEGMWMMGWVVGMHGMHKMHDTDVSWRHSF